MNHSFFQLLSIWFSLLHELGHVRQRKMTKTLVDFEANDSIEDFDKEADQFAKDLLIPPNDFALFSATNSFSEKSIRDFANALYVHPGIVVGRLQKEELIPYSHLNHMKQKFSP